MLPLTRRHFLDRTLIVGATEALSPSWLRAASEPVAAGGRHLASFCFDVTPPTGHALCDG